MKRETILSIIITAIISVIVGYYFWGRDPKISNPVITITNSPALIFDKSVSSPKIKLVVNDSIPISENVYLITIAVWNNGNKSIEKEDVRKDFYLLFQDSSIHILDYRIVSENLSGTANFTLHQTSERRFKINWDYFDPDYGFKVQFIFTGERQTPISFSGSAVGAKFGSVTLKDPDTNKMLIGLIILLCLAGIIPVILIPVIVDRIKEKKSAILKTSNFWGFLFVLVLFLFVVGVLIIAIYQLLSTVEVPF